MHLKGTRGTPPPCESGCPNSLRTPCHPPLTAHQPFRSRQTLPPNHPRFAGYAGGFAYPQWRFPLISSY